MWPQDFCGILAPGQEIPLAGRFGEVRKIIETGQRSVPGRSNVATAVPRAANPVAPLPQIFGVSSIDQTILLTRSLSLLVTKERIPRGSEMKLARLAKLVK